MGEKEKTNESNFWPGFCLGATIGAGVVYFLQESDPEKKEKLIQVVRDLLSNRYDNRNGRESDGREGKKPTVNVIAPKTMRHTFRRHGKAL